MKWYYNHCYVPSFSLCHRGTKNHFLFVWPLNLCYTFVVVLSVVVVSVEPMRLTRGLNRREFLGRKLAEAATPEEEDGDAKIYLRHSTILLSIANIIRLGFRPSVFTIPPSCNNALGNEIHKADDIINF